MVGRSSESRTLQYVGFAVAGVAVVGTVAFGWEFGGDDQLPLALGAAAVVVAVVVTLVRRTGAGD
jgi:hypothetical protein